MIYLQWSNASQLKYLAILPCHLSIITIHISATSRQFSDIHISQTWFKNSFADRLSGKFATKPRLHNAYPKHGFVANLPPSLSAKEFWKSVNIWGSYGQEFSVLFFLIHGVYIVKSYQGNYSTNTVKFADIFLSLTKRHFYPLCTTRYPSHAYIFNCATNTL